MSEEEGELGDMETETCSGGKRKMGFINMRVSEVEVDAVTYRRAGLRDVA